MPRPAPKIPLVRLDGKIPAPVKKAALKAAAAQSLSLSQYIAAALREKLARES